VQIRYLVPRSQVKALVREGLAKKKASLNKPQRKREATELKQATLLLFYARRLKMLRDRNAKIRLNRELAKQAVNDVFETLISQ